MANADNENLKLYKIRIDHIDYTDVNVHVYSKDVVLTSIIRGVLIQKTMKLEKENNVMEKIPCSIKQFTYGYVIPNNIDVLILPNVKTKDLTYCELFSIQADIKYFHWMNFNESMVPKIEVNENNILIFQDMIRANARSYAEEYIAAFDMNIVLPYKTFKQMCEDNGYLQDSLKDHYTKDIVNKIFKDLLK